jgi:DNA-binding MltR family transcriptional regulator
LELNLSTKKKNNEKSNNLKHTRAAAPSSMDPFLKEIDTSDDFARIVVGVATVDVCLVAMLDKFLVDGATKDELLSHVGIVGSLASRAKLCYTLGLISKTIFNEVLVLAGLRNLVAHTPEKLTFRSESVKSKVLEMKWLNTWIERNYGPIPEITNLYNSQIQHKFSSTVALLCTELKSATANMEKRVAATDTLSMFHLQFYNKYNQPLNEVPKHLKELRQSHNEIPASD